MNVIKTKVNFKKGTCTVTGMTLVSGDYNSTEIKLTMDNWEGNNIFEMIDPDGNLVYLYNITGEIIPLYVMTDTTTIHEGVEYIKYIDSDDNVYWYNKDTEKLYDSDWEEVQDFDLDDYTKVQHKASLFQQKGSYKFEISKYNENDQSKLTSASGTIKVRKEQIVIGDEIVTPYLPVFDDLINRIQEEITKTSNLNIDVNKVGNVVTITFTDKEGNVKLVQLKDGGVEDVIVDDNSVVDEDGVAHIVLKNKLDITRVQKEGYEPPVIESTLNVTDAESRKFLDQGEYTVFVDDDTIGLPEDFVGESWVDRYGITIKTFLTGSDDTRTSGVVGGAYMSYGQQILYNEGGNQIFVRNFNETHGISTHYRGPEYSDWVKMFPIEMPEIPIDTIKVQGQTQSISNKTVNLDVATTDDLSQLINWKTKTGKDISIDDAINYKFNNVELSGDTEQETTTGKNLINISSSYEITGGPISVILDEPVPSGTYVISIDEFITQGETDGLIHFLDENNDQMAYAMLSNTLKTKTITVSQPIVKLRLYSQNTASASTGITSTYKNMMLSVSGGEYEPYTGGQPSPSPDYPQEINNVKASNLISSHVKSGNNILFNGATSASQYIFEPGTYTLSYKSETETRAYYRTATDGAISLGYDKTITFTANEQCNIYIYRNGLEEDEVSNIQLTKNSIPTPYSPYGVLNLNVTGKNLITGLLTDDLSTSSKLSKPVKANENFYLYIKTSDVTSDRVYAYLGENTTSVGTIWVTNNNGILTFSGSRTFEFDKIKLQNTIVATENMLSLGSTATTYEPYKSNTIPFNIGQKEFCKLPNGVSDKLWVNLKTGEYGKTGNIGKVVLDGSENWDLSNLCYTISKTLIPNSNIPKYTNNYLCNNFIPTNRSVANVGEIYSGTYNLNFNYDDGTIGVNQFKTWLSSHNTEVYYELATPTTETLGTLSEENLAKLRTYKDVNNITTSGSNVLPDINLIYAGTGSGATGSVNSVNGKTGIVQLTASDIPVLNSQSIQHNLERIDDSIGDLYDNKQDNLTAGSNISIVNNVISATAGINIQVVQTLPTTGESNVIYLVPTNRETPNIYDEYIYVNNSWEKIGTTEVDLTDYVKNTDYAASSKGGVIKSDTNFATYVTSDGKLRAEEKTYAQYQSLSNYIIVGKGTLENVIAGKGLVSNTDYASSTDGGTIKVRFDSTTGTLYIRNDGSDA